MKKDKVLAVKIELARLTLQEVKKIKSLEETKKHLMKDKSRDIQEIYDKSLQERHS
jgi:hypothetical protein